MSIEGGDLPKLDQFTAPRAATADADILAAASMPAPDTNPKTVFGEAKTKFSVIPIGPLYALARVFVLGARKYGRYNWRGNTVSSTVYFDAALRHLFAWYEGEDDDPESGEPHLAHVVACVFILMDAKIHSNLNDNREEM